MDSQKRKVSEWESTNIVQYSNLEGRGYGIPQSGTSPTQLDNRILRLHSFTFASKANSR